MREGEDHMIMVTRQEPRPLQCQPALGLEIRALRTGPVPTGVVPDAGDVTVWTRLHMAPQRRRPALHDRAGGFPDMGGQRVQRLVGRKGVLEDRLQRDECHRCLRTYGLRASSGGFVQYHANYPRCKRLVQRLFIGKREYRESLLLRPRITCTK